MIHCICWWPSDEGGCNVVAVACQCVCGCGRWWLCVCVSLSLFSFFKICFRRPAAVQLFSMQTTFSICISWTLHRKTGSLLRGYSSIIFTFKTVKSYNNCCNKYCLQGIRVVRICLQRLGNISRSSITWSSKFTDYTRTTQIQYIYIYALYIVLC